MTDRYKEAIQGARDCVERNKDGGVYLPDLLVVIDSQQAEIERLKKENDEMFDSYTQAFFLQTKRTTEAIKNL